MVVKIVFIGNPLGGDDGIGPYLYNELKDHPKLSNYDLLELGVIGFDLLSYIGDDDKLIIVDAVYSKRDIGKVRIVEEKDLSKDLSVVSQHDFGIEQTATILRRYKPKLEKINIIGVNVYKINAFTNKLSDEILGKIDEIKDKVINNIIKIANE